jgi:predicted RNA-binding Zn-ribbon protein involved in translation (DUF1610 family)
MADWVGHARRVVSRDATCHWTSAPATCHAGGVTTRDTWQVHLSCPACGAIGEAEVSEDNHPYALQTGTLTVDRVSDGFRTRTLGGTMRTTKFECVRCGMVTQR